MAVVALADRVFRVPTAPGDLVNSFLFCADDGSVTVVDAGLKAGGRFVVKALRALGKQPGDVTSLVLTHGHMDHAGGVRRVRTAATRVLAHEYDVEWLAAGREPTCDSASLGGRLVNLVSGIVRKPWYAPVEVDRVLVDGETLPICGGLRVIHTPGHTPGHVSLLHEPTGVLITGDAVMNVRGLRRAPRMFCSNLRMEEETRSRLVDLDFDVAAFTHGAEIRKDAKRALEEFVVRDPRVR